MNYRHAFHAGNHTEVFKHAILIFLLEHLLQKTQPFMVLDSHAGIGLYDLRADQAVRTGEAEDGVAKIIESGLSSCPRYVDLVRSANADKNEVRFYPGSPEIIRRLLRSSDRLFACELHPDDFVALENRYRRDKTVFAQNRDGYEAVNAIAPPMERRGLIFVDPPFERKDEARRMIAALEKGIRKWATGIYCLWYPIKDASIGNSLRQAVIEHAYPKSLNLEFLPYRQDGMSLAGSGLIICNTPWRIDERAEELFREITPRLGDGRGSWTIRWLTQESERQ